MARRPSLGPLVAAATATLVGALSCPSPVHGEPASSVARAAPIVARARSAEAELRAAVAPTEPVTSVTPVSYEPWHGTSFGAYLAPKGAFWSDDGGIDVVVHFNAAMLAGRSWQASGANAVIVSAAFGSFGSGAYQEAMADPGRFGRMVSEVVASVAAQRKPGTKLHVRHLGLVAWSAGFGAVGRILAVPRYFEQLDSVILLDALQAGYKDPSRGAAQGADHVSLTGLAPYIRFAREAMAGRKQLVVTHTSIVPPQYASTTEATTALAAAVGAVPQPTNEASGAMVRTYRVDEGGLHLHGFHGAGPGDHMRHLHLVGDVVHEFLVPRWTGAGAR
ncbi:MAG TPA: hypothetical protein PLR99_25645 [Polyangiaceae bacterium]|nr:hypothetical protein [Polyangiaceae bacterium]